MGYHLSVKSLSNLARVHPDLIRVIALAIQRTPVDFAVTEGARTIERQHRLLRDGYSKTLHSKHLIQDDGFAHAVDLMAVGDLNRDDIIDHQDRAITWRREWYTVIAENGVLPAAEALGVGVRWGGRFKGFFDGPHFELSP